MTTYEEFVSTNEHMGMIVPRESWDFLQGSSNETEQKLLTLWEKNARRNLRKLYNKYGSVIDNALGFASDKAVIGVGAGPSYHINKDILKDVSKLNLQYKVKDQSFIVMTSNHQYKTLLNDGIFPHFVVLLDATPEAYGQLCEDVPDLGQDSILIASLFADPDTLNKWVEQGKEVWFYLTDVGDLPDIYEQRTGKKREHILIPSAGNIMNTIWLLAMSVLHSNVHICVGNDYSFEYTVDPEKRAESFYADGNVEDDNDRNQANDFMAWQGFEFSSLVGPKPMINLKTVGTSRQMFLYKTWTEMHVAAWTNELDSFKFINCSEQGILGVIAKDWDVMQMNNPDNWVLMDHICKNWLTMKLKDAITMYLEARAWLSETSLGARDVGCLVPKMGGVANAGPDTGCIQHI